MTKHIFADLDEIMICCIRVSKIHSVELIHRQSHDMNANHDGCWSHIEVSVVGDCTIFIFGGSKI
jgi:hypothetical protein